MRKLERIANASVVAWLVGLTGCWSLLFLVEMRRVVGTCSGMSERNQRRRWLECRLILVLAICGSIQAAESGPPDPPTNSPIASAVDTNSQQDTMRSLLQLQEQMHATRLAMQRDRQENAAPRGTNPRALRARPQ